MKVIKTTLTPTELDINLSLKADLSLLGVPSGIASLDGTGVILDNQLPDSVITSVNGHLGPTVVLDKADIELGNVDNTSDEDKPVSTAVQLALADKMDKPTGTTSQYLRGDGSVSDLPKQRGAFGINIQTPSDGNRVLFTMPFSTTIVNFNDIQTTSGTCTLALKINGVNVGGMSSINVTNTPQNIQASSNNVGSAGHRVELSISSNNDAANLSGTLYLEASL